MKGVGKETAKQTSTVILCKHGTTTKENEKKSMLLTDKILMNYVKKTATCSQYLIFFCAWHQFSMLVILFELSSFVFDQGKRVIRIQVIAEMNANHVYTVQALFILHRYGSDKIQRKLFEIRWNEGTFCFVGFPLRVSMHKASIDAGAATAIAKEKRGATEESVRETKQSQYLSVFWVNVVIQTEWITNLDISRPRDRIFRFGGWLFTHCCKTIRSKNASNAQSELNRKSKFTEKISQTFRDKIHCKIFGLAVFCPTLTGIGRLFVWVVVVSIFFS